MRQLCSQFHKHNTLLAFYNMIYTKRFDNDSKQVFLDDGLVRSLGNVTKGNIICNFSLIVCLNTLVMNKHASLDKEYLILFKETGQVGLVKLFLLLVRVVVLMLVCWCVAVSG